MNIYAGPKDEELIRKLEEEMKKRKRSFSYLVKEILRKHYNLGNGGD